MTGMRFQNATADNAELVILQGKSLQAQLVWGGSTPINVTGFTARLSVRPSLTHQGTPTADFTIQNNRVSVGSADGKFTFTMDATASAALPAPFTGVYEIEVTQPDGVVHRAVSGTATILAEVVK